MKKLDIAKICYEANCAYNRAIGDKNFPFEDVKESMLEGITLILRYPDTPPEDLHDYWLVKKTQDGWKYGRVKSLEKKTHPCLVDFDKLPKKQKGKDKLFRGIVNALTVG